MLALALARDKIAVDVMRPVADHSEGVSIARVSSRLRLRRSNHRGIDISSIFLYGSSVAAVKRPVHAGPAILIARQSSMTHRSLGKRYHLAHLETPTFVYRQAFLRRIEICFKSLFVRLLQAPIDESTTNAMLLMMLVDSLMVHCQ